VTPKAAVYLNAQFSKLIHVCGINRMRGTRKLREFSENLKEFSLLM
jgi:hypothetical protein